MSLRFKGSVQSSFTRLFQFHWRR